MNDNNGISTLTMGAEVILMYPKFISTAMLQTEGEQEQSALCRVEINVEFISKLSHEINICISSYFSTLRWQI